MTPAGLARAAATRLRESAAVLVVPTGREREPGALHDLRVACRRLEIALRLWTRGRDARDARAATRRIRRAAGPAREHEVLGAMLRTRRAGAAALPAALRQAWLAQLSTGPDAEMRVAWPTAAAVASLTRRVERVARSLPDDAELAVRSRDRLRRWRAAARARLRAGLASGEVEALHRARLALKRWRYAEEARAAAELGRARAGTKALLVTLRRWQRALGEQNDRAMLIAFASRSEPEARPFAGRLEALRLARLRSLRRLRDEVAPPPPSARPSRA